MSSFQAEIEMQDDVEEQMLDTARKVLFIFMQRAEQYSTDLVPVDTGRLKNSIRIKPRVPGNDEYTLVAGTDYAASVEFGTGRQTAQPYMRPAVRRALSELDNIIKEQTT